ncbi:hypothetical protein [Homoserinibacter sp. GY 40078]|uniref:hypothetical protein n=1 Tax=Homoserinibacter sp. GY 40078 TaxID=2603275 RepID=UPI0011CAF3DD|nr:hypothetical protein [Homoserinibacter sp. GY 40078]TXK19507.1 hypothetical protein FVQ89_06370 [Homoserinibacter sp. GY 40078]
MSYDLTVYFETDPTDALIELIEAEPDLSVATDGPGWVVTRGAGTYCCSIARPVRVEEEDLPDEVVSRSVRFSFQVDVLVEGSTSASIARTRKLIRAIVRALGGMSWDPQTDAIDPAGARRSTTPEPAGLVDLVEFGWYAPSRIDVASQYLASVGRYLPEAAPRRFGSFEPLQYRLDRDGPSRFISESADDDLLHFSGTKPVLDGSIGAGSRGTTVHLSVLAASLHEAQWRDPLQALFLDLAQRLDCFFAVAEVVRNFTWSGSQIRVGPEVERKFRPRSNEGWMGLPPHPVWWAFLGSQYSTLIDATTNGARTIGAGTFIELSTEPLNRDALAEALPRRGLLHRDPAPWISPDLQMKPVEGEHRRMPPPAIRANVIPDGLGVQIAPPGYLM